MINNNYLVDTDNVNFDYSGGQCDCLPIKQYDNLVFKTFKKKQKALEAYAIQKKLSRLDLAPKLFSSICKIAYYYSPHLLEFWIPKQTVTGWGFITEKASLIDYSDTQNIPYREIHDLVQDIRIKTKMKFWDCHEHNVGYIKRGLCKKLVCIDTGPESFKGYANAWGFEEPGPKCPYCLRYKCKCKE